MKKSNKVKKPWDFKPSDADQRAAPSPGAGTYWGRAIRNPIGKIRDGTGVNPLSEKRLGVPPRSVV